MNCWSAKAITIVGSVIGVFLCPLRGQAAILVAAEGDLLMTQPGTEHNGISLVGIAGTNFDFGTNGQSHQPSVGFADTIMCRSNDFVVDGPYPASWVTPLQLEGVNLRSQSPVTNGGPDGSGLFFTLPAQRWDGKDSSLNPDTVFGAWAPPGSNTSFRTTNAGVAGARQMDLSTNVGFRFNQTNAATSIATNAIGTAVTLVPSSSAE